MLNINQQFFNTFQFGCFNELSEMEKQTIHEVFSWHIDTVEEYMSTLSNFLKNYHSRSEKLRILKYIQCAYRYKNKVAIYVSNSLFKEEPRLTQAIDNCIQHWEQMPEEPIEAIPQQDSRPAVEPIVWLGTVTEIVRLVNELIKAGFIKDGKQHELVCQHFIQKDNSPFDSNTLATTLRNIRNRKKDTPLNEQKLINVVVDLKK